MNPLLPYRRLLIKISGEAFQGASGFGLDMEAVASVAHQLAAVKESHEVAVVLGGGNFFRGAFAKGLPRQEADEIGMLATVMNAYALRSACLSLGIPVCLLSARATPPYSAAEGKKALSSGQLVICAGGAGVPFITTDTAGVIRACELECSAMLKGTKVDGIYDKDPLVFPEASFFPSLTYEEALLKRLEVMDQTAMTLALENGLPLIVFSMARGLPALMQGQAQYTCLLRKK